MQIAGVNTPETRSKSPRSRRNCEAAGKKPQSCEIAVYDARPVRKPLEFKKRVRMREDAPVEVPARRLASHVVPVASYWLASGLVIYGIASHSLPIGRWVESIEESASAEPELVAAAEPAAPEPPPPEPAALPPPAPANELLAPEPVPAPPPEPAPAFAVATIEAPATPPPLAEPPPAPRAAPAPSLAAASPREQTLRREPLSVAGPGTSDALVWRTPRDPFEEALPPLAPPLAMRDRKRAADDDDFEEPEAPAARKPEPKQPERAIPAIASASSCEAAVAAYNEQMDMTGARRTADLPREAFAAVLDRGTYMTSCGVPDTMRVDICAAVQRGRAIGVTVVTKPASGAVQACVARAVRGLRFPSNPRLDVARTRFE
jgi:hypothetical protein